MKKITFYFIFGAFLIASPVFAQNSLKHDPQDKYLNDWKYYNTADDDAQLDNEQRLSGIAMVTVAKRDEHFIIGENSQSFTAHATVMPYEMNKFETTYALWCRVMQQAIFMGYEFENLGQEGSLGRRAKMPTEKGKLQPVVSISWRDAVVWCNALSEIEGLTPCYTYQGKVVRSSLDSAKVDLVKCNMKANGYRLPTEAEWEYAARKSKTGTLERGDYPSGFDNSDGEINCNVNSDGTKEVASSCKKNIAGLYDMAGNVLEFCFDWYAEYSDEKNNEFGSERVCRGGSWSKYTPFCAAGDRYSYDPGEAYNFMGFRICRTLQTE